MADRYRLLRYQIGQDIMRCGQQIDILAIKGFGESGQSRVMVECKYKSGSAKVSNDEVHETFAAFNLLRAKSIATSCVIVTTNGFTKEAEAAAHDGGIHLVTLAQLTRTLLDFNPHLELVGESYRECFGVGATNWYIETNGRQRETNSVDSLTSLAEEWRLTPNRKPLAILGGYGTGKSSFCLHYACKLLETQDAPIPVILRLRDFYKKMSIRSVIRDLLEEECNEDRPRFTTFLEMFREGHILLLLDGFDEMAGRADYSTLENNLAEIETLVKCSSNVILTCRPEFFVNSDEETNALRPAEHYFGRRQTEYSCIDVALWDSDQVEQFVRARIGGMHPSPAYPAEYYIEHMRSLPGFDDTASRPVHLDLLVCQLPTLIKEGTPITRANLYGTHIQEELRREVRQNRRLTVMTDKARLRLLRAIAIGQAQPSALVLDYSAARDIIQLHLSVPSNEIDSVTRDFLTRSFLSRRGDQYVFAHRSIGEYLMALEITNSMLDGDPQHVFSLSGISPETVGMVLELMGGVQGLSKVIRTLGMDSLRVIGRERAGRGMKFVMTFIEQYFALPRPWLRDSAMQARVKRVQLAETAVTESLADLKRALGQNPGVFDFFRDSFNESDASDRRCVEAWSRLIASSHELATAVSQIQRADKPE